jgi:carbon monoxide dehydrogenase subunit G
MEYLLSTLSIMATVIKVSTTIHATPQLVWEHLMNPENLKYWLTGFVSVKHLKGTIGEAGSTSQLKFIEKDKEMEITETVLCSHPGQHYSFRMESTSFSTENDIRLISFGSRTELIQTVQFVPNGIFMKLFAPLIKSQMKKRMLHELLALKNFIETNNSKI